MKKIILIFSLVSSVLALEAQTMKVAILEPVDKVGDIQYAHKLILRSNLSKAVTDMFGYEAYDRTDMDAIMGEQNFQRTGMVSDEQIKRLGEMTGASYILVSEAVKVDDAHMFITAKILNVESAKTEMTDNCLMGQTPEEIQTGCQKLAANLLKEINGQSPVSSSTSTENQQIQMGQQQMGTSNSTQRITAQLGTMNNVNLDDMATIYVHRPFKYMGSAWGHFIEVNDMFTTNVTSGTTMKLQVAPGRYSIKDTWGIGSWEKVKEKSLGTQVTSLVVKAGDQYIITIDEAAGVMGQAEKDDKKISKLKGKEKYIYVIDNGSIMSLK